MTQRILGSVVAAALLTTSAFADDALMQRFEKMEKEMAALKAELNAIRAENSKLSTQLSSPVAVDDKKEVASAGKLNETLEEIQDQLDDLNKKTNGNNLKFGVDFRTSVDNLHYKMADGSKQENDALLSNRLWLNMNYAATKNLSFTGQLAYNKTFGQRSMVDSNTAGMEGFDWISSEAAYDDTLRVRSAYFFYQDDEFMGADVPWTVSIGRRPSTEGHLVNLRDDVKASSPLAHTVNVEFDGASAKFGTEELIGLDGSYFKLCLGRGMSNAEPRFGSSPYSGNDATTNDVDMAGIIVVPYDDKQYSTGFQYTYANNLIDQITASTTDFRMKTVGGLHTATAFAMVNGIGDGINDFLDETIFFVSGAMSKTDPYEGKGGMLGSTDSQTGYSYWIGTQFPSLLTDEGRWGAEFNHGSNYWRPITYGEDTLIGSKIAARGDAYELYFTEPLVDDILTFQLRYTYIDYDYAGSNGFFGSTTGTPMSMSEAIGAGAGSMVVDKAQDIRAYIRYKF
ncbi:MULTISPECIES: DUF3373 family protein [unclassified Sulfuricurvum]|uniref:DUF3373 family protein n=1 Tax=unclassified Sulfuricurvum TaxID=2632390 RepID=UPI0002997891|nr:MULTISPECIES: DUF3373 family protein [unclassified Sulfuricurvum]AFV96515.1 hypothetical protein B649_01005 [Candidatus Sulfuricurvum sp. RIFRC-1]HBM35973.1 DUF3373 domain-containing protein [Sulfuricurvum sp.]